MALRPAAIRMLGSPALRYQPHAPISRAAVEAEPEQDPVEVRVPGKRDLVLRQGGLIRAQHVGKADLQTTTSLFQHEHFSSRRDLMAVDAINHAGDWLLACDVEPAERSAPSMMSCSTATSQSE